MKSLICLLICLSAVGLATPMGKPYNVTYDGRSLLLNGNRELFISGSVHYPRSSVGMWPGILQRSKEAGINLIETYVFWNLHQPTKDDFIFEDNGDLMKFLQLCMDNELYVNLRIGPYVCAEWNYGGFPEWLREEPGMIFRDYNQPFMDAMQKWMTQLVDYIRPMFASKGGPIILAQVENEYGNVEHYYGVNGTKYVQWAVEFAHSLDIGIPWIMCAQGDQATIINTCNGFYCDQWLESHWATFPDQPGMWTENWPGWFQTWGEPKPSRPVEDVAYSVAKWFAAGGSHMNYYMWQGGSNFGRWSGGPWIVTSYDYDVALDEYGLPHDPKYTHLSNLHKILLKYKEVLLNNKPPQPIPVGPNQQVQVYGSGPNSLSFIVNSDTTNVLEILWNNDTYVVPPWSVTIVSGDRTSVFNTAILTAQNQFNKFMSPVKSTRNADVTFGWWPEPVFANANSIHSAAPLEQLDITHDTTDYLWYFTNITTTSNPSTLVITNTNDFVVVLVDGAVVGSYSGGDKTLELNVLPGPHTLTILTQTMGLVNYGPFLEQWKRGVQGTVTLNSVDITNNGWSMQPGLAGEILKVYTTGGSENVQWNYNVAQGAYRPLTWMMYSFEVDSEDNNDTAYALDLNGLNKGFVWVNGRGIGRYWLVEGNGDCTYCQYAGPYSTSNCRVDCNEPSQRYYHVPRDWLQQKNLVVVFEQLGAPNPQGIQLVKRSGGVLCGIQQESYPAENTEVYLRCDPGTHVTSFEFVSFGNPTGTCGSFTKGTCDASDATFIISELCLGETSCYIPVSVDTFGDPCPGVSKTLAVQATCL